METKTMPRNRNLHVGRGGKYGCTKHVINLTAHETGKIGRFCKLMARMCQGPRLSVNFYCLVCMCYKSHRASMLRSSNTPVPKQHTKGGKGFETSLGAKL